MATATAVKVKEAVKESLLGTEDPTLLSTQTRSTFLLHAKKDPEAGEYYMGEEEFINAIAPKGEDYVRSN
jgi:solute carrier family 25 (mitochondrial aspartate/glutamate transporter), member 12/13